MQEGRWILAPEFASQNECQCSLTTFSLNEKHKLKEEIKDLQRRLTNSENQNAKFEIALERLSKLFQWKDNENMEMKKKMEKLEEKINNGVSNIDIQK